MENVRAALAASSLRFTRCSIRTGCRLTDLIYYDPTHPDTVVFPMIISTWFAPGVLVIIGLIYIIIGSFLLGRQAHRTSTHSTFSRRSVEMMLRGHTAEGVGFVVPNIAF